MSRLCLVVSPTYKTQTPKRIFFSIAHPHYTPATMSANQTRPGHRDMMFCHECADEWYRDQHGLTCPECGSDFTEIVSGRCGPSPQAQLWRWHGKCMRHVANVHQIEQDHDPRDAARFDDDNFSMPDLQVAPLHQHPNHNPWGSDDPEEADISNLRFSQTAPGRFNVQATLTRSVSPQMITGTAPGPIGGFMQMLTNLARVSGQTQDQQWGQGEGLFSGQTDGQSHSAHEEAESESGRRQPQPRTGRFIYHGGARLYPRDANNPGPRIEPVDDISK